MSEKPATVKEYLNQIPLERKEAFDKLRQTVLNNIPEGFTETINYGMIGYVIPHSIYPNGYHCNTELPLPFSSLANQKNFIGFYHMGIYANPVLHDWFVDEYKKTCKYKLDMGKSCIRFKKMDDIPFELIGKLMQKMTVENWISLYEKSFVK